jgi:hypothetical protein
MQSSHGTCAIAERVAPRVAVLMGIGKLAATHTVEDYENDLLRD